MQGSAKFGLHQEVSGPGNLRGTLSVIVCLNFAIILPISPRVHTAIMVFDALNGYLMLEWFGPNDI